ncbi:MAG: STN domain-containing protein, partial [Sphingomonadales bacterium]
MITHRTNNPGMLGKKIRLLGLTTAVSAFALLTGAALSGPAMAQSKTLRNVDVSAQATGPALLELAEESGVQIMFEPGLTSNLTTSGVRGNMTVEDALARLLSGTGLTFERVSENVLVVTRQKSGSISTLQPTRVANNGNDAPDAGSDNDDDDEDSEPLTTETDAGDTEVVIVTGSHIRGAGPTGSEVFIYDRKDIDELGFATIPE